MYPFKKNNNFRQKSLILKLVGVNKLQKQKNKNEETG